MHVAKGAYASGYWGELIRYIGQPAKIYGDTSKSCVSAWQHMVWMAALTAVMGYEKSGTAVTPALSVVLSN